VDTLNVTKLLTDAVCICLTKLIRNLVEIRGLYQGLLCISGYTASNSRNTEEMGNDLEGSGPDLIDLTHRHMTGETGDNHKKPQLRQAVSRPRFEPGTSRIEFGSVVACASQRFR
jgi:hypothetical protein